jgi:pimeloyl-ACP methyl ester carboxylesterase
MSSTSTRLPISEGPGAGHWLAEQAPEEMLAALTEFLAPYREDGGGLR